MIIHPYTPMDLKGFPTSCFFYSLVGDINFEELNLFLNIMKKKGAMKSNGCQR